MIEILGVILSLSGLMYFAYRGVNVLVLAPLMALFATLFDTQAPALATYTQVFMPALGGYLLKYFPLFLLGSIFGQLMGDSGAAQKIGSSITGLLGAKHAPLAVVLSCAVLTYGGVSLFVIAFCMYPIAAALFHQAEIPKRFIPASIALGSFTFTMTAFPGTPAIQNAIPMPFFGTTAFAAPGLGFIAGFMMFGLGMLWLHRRISKAQEQGEKYLPPSELSEETFTQSTQTSHQSNSSVFLAFFPLILVLTLNFLFSKLWLPYWEANYLSEEKFGGIDLKAVLGIWAIILAVTAAILAILILHRRQLTDPLQSVNKGTMGSLLPIFNTASEVGYGATIASLGSFVVIKSSILGIFPQWPLISEAISINILAGITGSASGGLSIALQALGANYLEMANQVGLSPELLHRVASLSSGGLDTLPHNGAVITLLGICGLTHKKSYADIFMVAVAFPFLSTATTVLLGTLIGSF